jgi:hypothetical protein
VPFFPLMRILPKSLVACARPSTTNQTSALDTCLTAALVSGIDRHRGGGCPPTSATPPCVRVRTRRFELVTPNVPRTMTEARAI